MQDLELYNTIFEVASVIFSPLFLLGIYFLIKGFSKEDNSSK